MVPEDRAHPSRTIALRVAIVPASGRRPHPDPVFFLAGGPGQAATEAMPPVAAHLPGVALDHDLVFVDIRGTGSSSPLDCPVEDDPRVALRIAFDETALTRCLDVLTADPVHFTTAQAVLDLEVVRATLDAPRINLVGGSYGTRLALEYARAFGPFVRTMVLDGVAPPQMAMPEGFATDTERAFEALVGACQEDEGCARAFPDLRGDLHAALQRVASTTSISIVDPRTAEPVVVDVDAPLLAGGVRALLYSTDLSALLPLALHDASRGDLRTLIGTMLVFAQSVGTSMSEGLLLSMLCSEDLPRIDLDRQRLVDRKTFLGTSIIDAFASGCAHWRVAPAPETAGVGVETDIPTLLLSGAVDPVLPPRWGELAATGLSRHRHIVVPHAAHGTLTLGCIPDLVTEFIDLGDPSALDPTCAEEHERRPFFIDRMGPYLR